MYAHIWQQSNSILGFVLFVILIGVTWAYVNTKEIKCLENETFLQNQERLDIELKNNGREDYPEYK